MLAYFQDSPAVAYLTIPRAGCRIGLRLLKAIAFSLPVAEAMKGSEFTPVSKSTCDYRW